jgi:putative acetyltransferase
LLRPGNHPAIEVRLEGASDHDAVRQVVTEAFGQPAEAMLVDLLRTQSFDIISLVAEMQGKVVGHVLFTPVELEPPAPGLVAAGLAPLAVAPQFQHQGVGSALAARGCAGVGRGASRR